MSKFYYIILTSSNTMGLAEEVNEHHAKGYIPLGNIFVYKVNGVLKFAQAMVLEGLSIPLPESKGDMWEDTVWAIEERVIVNTTHDN